MRTSIGAGVGPFRMSQRIGLPQGGCAAVLAGMLAIGLVVLTFWLAVLASVGFFAYYAVLNVVRRRWAAAAVWAVLFGLDVWMFVAADGQMLAVWVGAPAGAAAALIVGHKQASA